MNHVIKLVAKYQKEKSDEIFVEIVDKLKNLINYYCNKANSEVDDFRQELLIKLYIITKEFKINKNSNLEINLFTKENIHLIKLKNYKNVNKIMKSKYISGFIKKYGKEVFDEAFFEKKKLKLFINEYNLFCNENQFIKYVNKTFMNCLLIHLDQTKKNDIISLDKMKDEGFEVEDYTQNKDEKYFINMKLLTIKEREFIEKFIDNDKVLSERKVAKILGISQQAVNKRKKKIVLKYKNILKE